MEHLNTDNIYHIYNHSNGSENLFREEKNYPFFLLKYEKHITPIAETFAYCLMPNHFHLLLKIKATTDLQLRNLQPTTDLQGFKNLEGLATNEGTNLQGFQNLEDLSIEGFISQQFSNLFNSYTKSINKTYNRKGSLFNPRFKRKLITSEQQFISTFLYIHLNPVKHGFTNNEEEWKWSSLHNYINKDAGNILNLDEAINRFDSYENIFYCLKERREKILSIVDEF